MFVVRKTVAIMFAVVLFVFCVSNGKISGQKKIAQDLPGRGSYFIQFNIEEVTVNLARNIVKARRNKVVQVAYEQLGKPYKWGGSGSDSFDCSGLTMYCYQQIDLPIPHSSGSQHNIGTSVGIDEILPGDIVGFRNWGHVGIYVGDGNFIHAPQSGEVVRLQPLNTRSDFAGGVRLLRTL
jgi:cell wall-associated NlpC family hydrolase